MATEQRELELITKVLRESNQDLSISEIQKQASLNIEPRTLLRRLDKLAAQKIIEKTGKNRGAAYKIVSNAQENNRPSDSELIPLTEESRELLTLVDRPQTRRTPAGYNREFLEQYKPNITSYLTTAEKKKLAELGKTARQNEPAGTYAKDILQRLLIDFSWNSSRLEGNTYSLLDTERLISIGEAADNKSAKDAQMILNYCCPTN